MQTKRCTKCGETKVSGEFTRDRANRDGLRQPCKQCIWASREKPVPAYPQLDPDFGHWLAGFIDGEGCFTIGRRPASAEVPWDRFSCRANVVLRADDQAVLEMVQATTAIGRLTDKAAQSREGRMASPQIGWWISSKPDCRRLVEILDAYPLRSKKARDYAIWREAAMWWSDQRRRGRGWAQGTFPYAWAPMAYLKQRLEEGRRFG